MANVNVKCDQCKRYTDSIRLHDTEDDLYYCSHCCMHVTRLREALETLEGTKYIIDPFTDAEANYAQRQRMTDRENKNLNGSWIRAYWRSR